MGEMYLAIQSDEDGNCVTVLSRQEIEEWVNDPEGYGIETILDEWPKEKSPMYWEEGSVLFLKAEIIKTKQIIKKIALDL